MEVRRRGGRFFASDLVLTKYSKGFWEKQMRKRKKAALRIKPPQGSTDYDVDHYALDLTRLPKKISLQGWVSDHKVKVGLAVFIGWLLAMLFPLA
jgi:hypothetical protein